MGMIPGLSGAKLPAAGMDDAALKKAEAVLQSMTRKERKSPQILDGGRRKRIAKGSGTSVEEVNRVLRQYEQMKKMMKMMRKGGRHSPFKGMGMPRF
jgi:signal recognition particle subunit SRP54